MGSDLSLLCQYGLPLRVTMNVHGTCFGLGSLHLYILYANNGDQPAMKIILPEESSLTGLKVKVLKGDEFPCGNRIIQPRHADFIQEVMNHKRNSTYILHVKWNHGDKYKRGLMKQMGLWYAQDTGFFFATRRVPLWKSAARTRLLLAVTFRTSQV